MLARWENEREMAMASIQMVDAMHREAGCPTPKMVLPFCWEKIIRMSAPERIAELRGCGYNNRQIADMLGYKDAQSVNSTIQRSKHDLREKGFVL